MLKKSPIGLAMSDRDIGQEILDGVKEIKDFKNGQKNLRKYALKESSQPKMIREKLE
jgi:putative transcriptional regulator